MSMTNNTTADTTANRSSEGGAIEPYGHYFVDDPAKFAMPGGGFKIGPVPPDDCISVIPVYSQSAIDTLRAQLEAAEQENRGAEEIARIYFGIAAEVIGESAVRAKRDHEIVQVASMRQRAEAAEADAARFAWIEANGGYDICQRTDGVWFVDEGMGVTHSGPTLAAAIDAARKAVTP